jgi:hypothetical protein
MPNVHLQPAQSLIEGFTHEELVKFARRMKMRPARSASKKQLVREITCRMDLDEITCALLELFPKRRAAGMKKCADEVRLDKTPRLHGNITVHVYSRTNPGLGRLLLENRESCIQLRLSHVQLFLDNRWPVIASDSGTLTARHLYAGFVGTNRIHAAAEMAPPKDKPFIIDEGEYGLRNGRLRLDFHRAGAGSFRVDLLRYSSRTGRPAYLLRPIA